MIRRRVRNHSQQHLAMEVSHSQIRVIAVTPKATGQPTARAYQYPWRHEANSLLSSAGASELAHAFKKIAQEHRWQGAKVTIALNGDFCVTRAISGSTSHIQQEMAALEKRSNLYLSLGYGEKSLGASVRQLDARNQHALLSVVNEYVLSSVITSAERAGFEIEAIEPSLVAQCRLVGHLQSDQNYPALIVALSEQGAEVGISHQGHLLLDYRPAARESGAELAEIIRRHLIRLRRYCDRYLTFTEGALRQVLVSGCEDSAEEFCNALRQGTDLQVEMLDQSPLRETWDFDSSIDSTHMASLGATLRQEVPDKGEAGPNLMERLTTSVHRRLVSATLRAAWPLATALTLLLIVWGWLATLHHRNDQLEMSLAQYTDQLVTTSRLHTEALGWRQTIEHLEQLADGLHEPSWRSLTRQIAACLPQDVWLTAIEIDDQGHVTLQGISYTEDGVFEFHRSISQLPEFRELPPPSSTQPTRASAGPALRFEFNGTLRINNDQGNSNDDTT